MDMSIQRAVLRALGVCGQVELAVSHVNELFSEGHVASSSVDLYNDIISGLCQSASTDKPRLAEMIVKGMGEDGDTKPDSTTLALLIETYTNAGAHLVLTLLSPPFPLPLLSLSSASPLPLPSVFPPSHESSRKAQR